jgi:hypothetical protein
MPDTGTASQKQRELYQIQGPSITKTPSETSFSDIAAAVSAAVTAAVTVT